jgi:hypothetical protein
MNWYLNPFTKVTWNYIHPILDTRQNGRSLANVYAMQFMFEF